MFGRKHKGRRRTNIVFVIFRLALSLVIFAVLLGGSYSAYKHFSGLDPLKLDPQTILINLIKTKDLGKAVNSILSSNKLTQNVSDKLNQRILGESEAPSEKEQPKLLFSFMLVADSHNDNVYLEKTIVQAKQNHPDIKFIIGLGDYTDVGTLEELKSAKAVLDNSGLRYFVLAGDHDLWDSRNKGLNPVANFNQVFGPQYQAFDHENFKFILLFNSDNYTGLGQEQKNWLVEKLDLGSREQFQGILVFVHEPLFHPSSDHIMGRVENNLKNEAEEMIKLFKEKGVKIVFAGDIHYFTEYVEPATNLSLVTIGALTTQRNTQAPRYAIVWVFDDGSVRVEDVEIR